MQRHGARQQSAAIFFLTLLLVSRVASMRVQVKHAKAVTNPKEILNKENPDAKLKDIPNGENLDKLVKEGKNILAKLKCDELPAIMAGILKNITSSVLEMCPVDKPCDVASASEEQVERLTLGAISIATYSDVADQKLCLGETMAHPEVAEAAKGLKGIWQTVLEGSGTKDVQKRMKQAGDSLAAWQADLANLKGSVLDRKLFFPSSIEDAAHCPEPCASCTKEHNSWWKDSERFKFKCIYNPEAQNLDPPSDAGLDCSAAQPRSSGNGYKSWCEVPDWKTSAYQKASLVAKVTCGAQSVLSTLQSGNAMPDSLMSTCLKIEEGKVVTNADMHEYKDFISQSDNLVSKGAKAAFSIFLSLGQVEGVGELRRGVRSGQQGANSSFTSEGSGTEVTFEVLDKCEPKNSLGGIFVAVGKVLIAFIAGVLIMGTVTVSALFLAFLALQGGSIGSVPAAAAVAAIVMGGSLSVGMLAGIIGGLMLLHSMRLSPIDCVSGEVAGGGCMDGMHFGATATVTCTSGKESITVSCNKDHGGAMTATRSCFPDPSEALSTD